MIVVDIVEIVEAWQSDTIVSNDPYRNVEFVIVASVGKLKPEKDGNSFKNPSSFD